jgi:hypothetical protein
MKNFILKNKVIISAFISALILVLQQAMSTGATECKAIGFAALLALLGVLAREWKGQGVTISGIIGTLAGVFVNIQSTGSFTWNEFLLSAAVAILMAVSSTLQPAAKEDPVPPIPYNNRDGLD